MSAVLFSNEREFKTGVKFINGLVIMKIAPPEDDLQLLK